MKETLVVCPKYGFTAVLNKEKFCPNCGAKLIKKCPDCGASIDHPMAQYCPVCGARYLQNERNINDRL